MKISWLNKIMAVINLALVTSLLALLFGCSTFSIKTTLPDGTIIEATHRNLLQNRKMTAESLDGFKFSSEVDNKDATAAINNTIDQAAPIAETSATGL